MSTNEALEACGDGAGGVGRARVVIGHRARRDAARWRARRRAWGWLERACRAREAGEAESERGARGSRTRAAV